MTTSHSRRWSHVAAAIGVVGATVAVHEAAHAAMAVRAGGAVKEVGIGFGPPLLRFRVRALPVVIRALPLGGYAAIDAERIPPRRRIAMLLAGPVANILAGLPLLVGLRRHPSVPLAVGGERRVGIAGFAGTLGALAQAAACGVGAVGRLAGAINVGLGVMNLLPIYPLDGGHVVMSVMEDRGVPRPARAAFARLTAAAFLLLAQAAMVADLRRLAQAREPGSRGTWEPS